MAGKLVLCRHGQSDWNLKNLFTGWHDVDLTDKGVGEARDAGQLLASLDYDFDIAYTSGRRHGNREALLGVQRTSGTLLDAHER